jgi:hypothetical protein
MKKLKNFILLSLFVLSFLEGNSQTPGCFKQTDCCNNYPLPCNQIRNSTFAHTCPPMTPTSPIVVRDWDYCVSKWGATHGYSTEPLIDYYPGQPLGNPAFPSAISHASLWAQSGNIGSGIAIGVPQFNGNYILSFYERISDASLNVNIGLIQCDTYVGMVELGCTKQTDNIPSFPSSHSQHIYCETNATPDGLWKHIVINFNCGDSYIDALWIYPTSDNSTKGWLEIAYPELINATNLSQNVCAPNCSNITIPNTPFCSVQGAQYDWYKPNGTLYSQHTSQITFSPCGVGNIGAWKVDIKYPSDGLSVDCSNEGATVTGTVNVSRSNLIPTITGPDKICTNDCITYNCGITLTCNVNAAYYEWHWIDNTNHDWTGPNSQSWAGLTSPGIYYVKEGNGPGECLATSLQKTITKGSCFPCKKCILYIISPNPGHLKVNIKVAPGEMATTSIKEVKIIDKYGAQRLHYQYASVKSVDINIASLQTDIYTAEVYDGTQWTSLQFVKQ